MEAIAITGIGCRFPAGAHTPASFWNLLRNGVDAISDIPASRFDIETFFDPRPATAGKTAARQGGFLGNVDQFDPSFFELSPREAVLMDPQQRLLLEVTWEALEDAGEIPAKLADTRTGVFVGMCYNDYEDLIFQDASGIAAVYVTTGGFRSLGSGRISHFFNLRGPSLTIDTACSSSLVAVHYACQSLQRGECAMALAAGSNLILEPQVSIAFSQGRMLSLDGRCKFGDARADGFVRSEGVAVVVLKPLSQALNDRDPIYAVIRGSAVNNDGRTSGSSKKPSRIGQEDLLREAYRQASVSPADLDYIEAHGTGTPVGDRAELEALGAVLGEGREIDRPCRVGSVKTNIGHTEGAAGIAGLIKAALCLKHRAIPASLHLQQANPDIAPQPALRIVRHFESLPPRSRGLLAGVSSFGISATNAHVVLEEPPRARDAGGDTDPDLPAQKPQLLPISAHTPEALRAFAAGYRAALAGLETHAALSDVCYTARVRRTHHAHRLALVGRTPDELIETLDAYLADEMRAGLAVATSRSRTQKIVFVCSGQGSQWLGMARELLDEPAFRDTIDRCEQAMRPFVDWSLLAELASTADTSQISRIDVIQPALFAIQIGLGALWRSWGVEPAAVIGHSMGEVAAAHIAGVLTIEDAARVICERSKLLKRVSGRGAMALVELSRQKAERAIAGFDDRISIAVSNGPVSTVLSGDAAALDQVLAELQHRNVFCRPVKVDVASHSPQVDPLKADLIEALRDLRPRAAGIPIYSTVAHEGDRPSFDAGYWMRNLREPVLFWPVVERLCEHGHDTFIELSPHPVLLPDVQRGLRHTRREGATFPSLRRDEDARFVLLESLGGLYASGYAVDWKKPFARAGRCVSLPTYPWQRERLWLDERRPKAAKRSGHPFIGEALRSAVQSGTCYWERTLAAGSAAWLKDHRVRGMVVLPAAAYVDMALSAAVELLGHGPHVLENLNLLEALILAEGTERTLQIVAVESASDAITVQCFSRPRPVGNAATSTLPAWTRHAVAAVRRGDASVDQQRAIDLDAIRARCPQTRSGADVYRALDCQDIAYGSRFQAISTLVGSHAEALGELHLADVVGAEARDHRLHPVLLDACFQVALATLPRQDTSLPVGLHELRLTDEELTLDQPLSVYVQHQNDSCDVMLASGSGRVIVEARGLRFQTVARHMPARDIGDLLYDITWRHQPLSLTRSDSPTGNWVIFADEGGLAMQVAEQLRAHGETPTLVYSGDRFEQTGPLSYLVDPSDVATFDRVFEQRCKAVVYSWPVEPAAADNGGAAVPRDAEDRVCRVIQVVQALVRSDSASRPRLYLVTRGAQPIGDCTSRASMAQAPLWGFGRVLRSEHPDLQCTSIDLNPDPTPGEVDALVAEMLTADGQESEIAFRGSERLVARLAHRAVSPHDASFTLSRDGTYLITGGLGALGLKVARLLCDRGARNLVLVGRRTPSETVHAALLELELAGVRLSVRQADVADREATHRLLEEVRRTMPPLRGVVHAAGVLDDGLFDRLDRDRVHAVMAPKAHGAWNLHSLTCEDPLDLFVLFSSVAAWIGTAGQANYAAANAFLDALAQERRRLGMPAISIAWGPWSEIGLAAAQSNRGDRLARSGLGSLTPEEGVHALDQLLRMQPTSVGVMAFDARLWRERQVQSGASLFEDIAPARERARPGEAARPLVDMRAALRSADAGRQRRALLEQHIREQIAQVVRIAPSRIESDTPFGTLGLDSLMALECRNRFEASLGVTVSATVVWNYPTLSALVPYVASQMGVSLDSVPEHRAEPPSVKSAGHHAAATIENLTDREAEALLASELAALGGYFDGQTPGDI